MTQAVFRKIRQLRDDPVLRRWLLARLTGQTPGEPAFQAHRPPYLAGQLPLPPEQPVPATLFKEIPADPPKGPIDLPLAGEAIRVTPGEETALFQETFSDLETSLALHRFSWIPLLGDDTDPAWVQALWTAWHQQFANPAPGWPWHPYTAAERAVNLLQFGRRQGLPGPLDKTLSTLAAHAPAIAASLEYFGDHHTGNHLSNNGRGLYLSGLYLGLGKAADLGGEILIEEAKRIITPIGMLREGSSHYHLLVTRNYLQCWLAAMAFQRPETNDLRDIAKRCLSVLPLLRLPGGLPLIGDISPDCPPDHLMGLLGGESGWTQSLNSEEKQSLMELRNDIETINADVLVADGWLQAGVAPWSGLWHAAPQGWSAMPGHGHQDVGGFELHYAGNPVFVDPGRGAYGEDGEAALYRSGAAHNTLLVDGQDPYPSNRPYYDEGFRSKVCGDKPILLREGNKIRLSHGGYNRLPGVCTVHRDWHFEGGTMTLTDRVEGSGRHDISRLLVTPLAVEANGTEAVLTGAGRACRITADADISVHPCTRWTAYGQGVPASRLVLQASVKLPWEGRITVEAL